MPANIPQVQTFTARTGVSGQIDLETRVRQLEERLAKLEAVIKINGNRVEIKSTGRMNLKASSIDLSAGGSSTRKVKVGNKLVAVKGDQVTGFVYIRANETALENGKVE